MPHWGTNSLALAVAAAALLAYGLTWLARWAAPKCGWVDRPDGERKTHQRVTPLLGGLAILSAFWISMWWAGLSGHLSNSAPVWGLACSACLMAGMGVWDDRWPLAARSKMFGQSAAVAPFVLSLSARPQTVSVLGWEVELGMCSQLLVACWLIMAVNAVNLSDGLDGAASSLAIACLLSVAFVVREFAGGSWIFAAALLLAASVAGFLLHNLPPARIFLGDAGSMTLGLIVGALVLLAMTDARRGFHLVPALAVLFVPCWDALIAILRRRLRGMSIGSADRGHIHHCLKDHGLSTARSLFILALLNGASATIGALSYLRGHDAWCLAGIAALAAGLMVGGVFGYREAMMLRASLVGGGVGDPGAALDAVLPFAPNAASPEPLPRTRIAAEDARRVA